MDWSLSLMEENDESSIFFGLKSVFRCAAGTLRQKSSSRVAETSLGALRKQNENAQIS